MPSPTTHSAVVTTAPRAPLTLHHLPTLTPTSNELLIHNLWTASTPLDLHQADGGLLVHYPQVLGDGVAGRIAAVGPLVTRLQPGDLVFGFSFRSQVEKAHQEYVLAPENMVGKVPEGWEGRLSELVTVPNNFVTAWHTLVVELGLVLEWPRPSGGGAEEEGKDTAVLVYGASSSVGQYVLQVLRYYGYGNVVATASKRNFELVRECGAKFVVDYHDGSWRDEVEARVGKVELVLDCIGSLEGSVRPISAIAGPGARVAVMLPVVVREPGEEREPEYSMDVAKAVEWAEEVEVRGVRTHHYLENDFHARRLQPDIMPMLLKGGVIKPNRQKIVEGASLLERAQKALDMLRRKEISGERLVWRVADGESG